MYTHIYIYTHTHIFIYVVTCLPARNIDNLKFLSHSNERIEVVTEEDSLD